MRVPQAWTCLLESEASTRRLGAAVARSCKEGSVVALCGPLGAGKTTFAQGFARGLDVPASVRVRSPSFTLCNQYSGRLDVLHVDFYRLTDDDTALDLGLYEAAGTSSVTIVEWADKSPHLIPGPALWIELEHEQRKRRATLWPEHDSCTPTLLEPSGSGQPGDHTWTLVQRSPPWEQSASRWSSLPGQL